MAGKYLGEAVLGKVPEKHENKARVSRLERGFRS